MPVFVLHWRHSAVRAIPSEALSKHAELSMDGAKMCARVSILCQKAAALGPSCWIQLRSLALQCLDVAANVGDAAAGVGARAAEVPSELMPVLGQVKSASSKLKKALAVQVVRGARALMRATEKVAENGQEVMLHSKKLAACSSKMTEALKGVADLNEISTQACVTTSELVQTISRLASEAAGCVGHTALSIGNAKQNAINFLAVLEAAGAWAQEESQERSPKEARKKKTSESDPDAESNNSSDSEDSQDSAKDSPSKEPWSSRVEKHRVLIRLNSEVVQLQQEVRKAIAKSPSLLEAVTTGQKGQIFALVSELIEAARGAVSREWRTSRKAQGASKRAEIFADAVKAELSFVFAAAAWKEVAVPSIEARLLRLASLLDCQLLGRMLTEDLFQHALALADGTAANELAERFEAAFIGMQVGFAGG